VFGEVHSRRREVSSWGRKELPRTLPCRTKSPRTWQSHSVSRGADRLPRGQNQDPLAPRKPLEVLLPGGSSGYRNQESCLSFFRPLFSLLCFHSTCRRTPIQPQITLALRPNRKILNFQPKIYLKILSVRFIFDGISSVTSLLPIFGPRGVEMSEQC